jgi:hypothetical protein
MSDNQASLNLGDKIMCLLNARLDAKLLNVKYLGMFPSYYYNSI